MTTREIYREYLQRLRQIYTPGETTTITDWVFESVAHLTRANVIKEPEQKITPEILYRLYSCLAELLLHKPVQYVLGEAWFYNMKFIINEQVLIPRPETEELVQLAINYCREAIVNKQKESINNQFTDESITNNGSPGFSIVDIGTGSGCIAIVIKKNLEDVLVHAIDVSGGALSVATQNAIINQADIIFSEIDFLEEGNWKQLPVFDTIISNPPYIPLAEKPTLARNVTEFEPHLALFVPDNAPLVFYERIALFGKRHLGKNGKIFVEIHEDYAKATSRIFEEYFRVEIKTDIFGKKRMIVASNDAWS